MLAIDTIMPTTNSLPACTVSAWLPVPIVSDVVDAALVPGAFAAVAALVAAFAALCDAAVTCPVTQLAMLMICVNIGSRRARKPPFARPVVGLLSSVTVEPSPPTFAGKVT
ncbi:hypothetical protein J8I87_05985 [Paraburkholderia sp. LEh10]|nr:hypothetical protein [Paraburkholderia sp. LEh10]